MIQRKKGSFESLTTLKLPMRRWWVQHCCGKSPLRLALLRSLWSTLFGLDGPEVLNLFFVIGNGLPSLFDQPEFEMIEML